MGEKYKLQAVHERDIERGFEDLNLSEPLQNGELKCGVCGCKIVRENFLAVYPDKNEIKVCYNKPECYEEVLNKGNCVI